MVRPDFLEARELAFALAKRHSAQVLPFYTKRNHREVGRFPGFVRLGREEAILWRGPAT